MGLNKDETRVCPPLPDQADSHAVAVKVPFNQPYTDLALADLLIAHGAPDEAVNVLAEWLTGQLSLQERLSKQNEKNASAQVDTARLEEDQAEDFRHLPKWFEIRVLGKLQAVLGSMTRKQSRAFRDVLGKYQSALTRYFGSSRPPLQLDQFPDRCKELEGQDEQRRIFYLLLGTEIDSLRTEVNFVPEITSFEDLAGLGRRASFLVQQRPDCLPNSPSLFDQDYKTAFIAEGKIVAGVIALAASDRMRAIGTASGERERAIALQKQGESWLRDGYVELRPIWKREREKQMAQDLPSQIFGQSQWEASADLASRVLARSFWVGANHTALGRWGLEMPLSMNSQNGPQRPEKHLVSAKLL